MEFNLEFMYKDVKHVARVIRSWAAEATYDTVIVEGLKENLECSILFQSRKNNLDHLEWCPIKENYADLYMLISKEIISYCKQNGMSLWQND